MGDSSMAFKVVVVTRLAAWCAGLRGLRAQAVVLVELANQKRDAWGVRLQHAFLAFVFAGKAKVVHGFLLQAFRWGRLQRQNARGKFMQRVLAVFLDLLFQFSDSLFKAHLLHCEGCVLLCQRRIALHVAKGKVSHGE